MAERVTELATFVNRARRLGRDVTGNAAGEGELFEHAFQALFILRNLWIDFAVRPFEPGVRNDPRAAVARTDDVDHVQVALLDHAIEMNVNKVETGRRAPMTHQTRLHVLLLERLFEQRIAVKIGLADGKIIRRAPPGVNFAEHLFSERAIGFR